MMRTVACVYPCSSELVLLASGANLVLFVIAGASREQGTALLNLFYPDHDNFWLGLIPGIPAVLAFC